MFVMLRGKLPVYDEYVPGLFGVISRSSHTLLNPSYTAAAVFAAFPYRGQNSAPSNHSAYDMGVIPQIQRDTTAYIRYQ